MSIAEWVRQQSAGRLREQAAYIRGMYAYAYGFPLVLMDMTRQVMTAVPKSGEYSAPIGQFHRIRDFVSPDFKNVVRISRSSLWATAFIDLDAEPVVFSHPATHGRYLVAQIMDMWTDNFASIGQPHHWRETWRLPDRRTPLERHAASRHRGHIPLLHALCVDTGPDCRRR